MDDPEDKKPEGHDDIPAKLADPKATKPDDWDDESDGEWEAPQIDNPDFKGAWSAKRIANPAYKGVWAPKKIANPEYEDDEKVYSFADFGFIGFDLWQVKGGTIFDNVIITDDKSEADAFAKKWKDLSELEKSKKKEEDDAKAAEDAKATADKKDDDKDADDDDDDEEKKEEA